MYRDLYNLDLEHKELYKYIVVYKNTYKDIKNTFNVLEQSTSNDEDRLIGKWEKWSYFGEYIHPITYSPSDDLRYRGLEKIDPKTENEKIHKDILMEIYNNFYATSYHYFKKYNLDIDLETMVKNKNDGNEMLWQISGPSIAKYDKNYPLNKVDKKSLAMFYHSDFIREPMDSEGWKFAITVLTYFNDDYEGGEIQFAIGNKLLTYKPEAGDILIFPSGHPDMLTEDNNVYLHAVLGLNGGNNKYLSRMYWKKYSSGSSEWHDGINKYGKEEWKIIYDKMYKQYESEHPARGHIEGGYEINES